MNELVEKKGGEQKEYNENEVWSDVWLRPEA